VIIIIIITILIIIVDLAVVAVALMKGTSIIRRLALLYPVGLGN
jgi:hypothetical protein